MTPARAARASRLLEARLSSELAELVRREGGEPVCAPARHARRRSTSRRCSPALIDDLATASGADRRVPHRRRRDARCSTRRATPACCDAARRRAARRDDRVPRAEARRGAAQARHPGARERARRRTRRPSCSRCCRRRLSPAQGVALLHDGGGNPALVEALRARGASARGAPLVRVAPSRRRRADRGADRPS